MGALYAKASVRGYGDKVVQRAMIDIARRMPPLT
jgi:hypothetical protein